jgi:integrase
LRAALKWAQKTGLIRRAPAVELPPVPPPRERYLSRGEAEKLIAAVIDPHVKLAILIMLTTAGRN